MRSMEPHGGSTSSAQPTPSVPPPSSSHIQSPVSVHSFATLPAPPTNATGFADSLDGRPPRSAGSAISALSYGATGGMTSGSPDQSSIIRSVAGQGTIAEYTFYHLFNSFSLQVGQIFARCTTEPLENEPDIESICSPGVEPKFDQLLAAFGHIARSKPAKMVDMFFYWRKERSDSLVSARAELFEWNKFQSKRTPVVPEKYRNLPVSPASYTSYLAHQVDLNERQSVVSIYILCRVLIAIITRCVYDSDSDMMLNRVENVIYGQLKLVDADLTERSKLKRCNWDMYAQVLGACATLRFSQVAKRFLTDFRMYLVPPNSTPKTAEKGSDNRMRFLIQRMKHIKINTPVNGDWTATCEFIGELAKIAAEIPWSASRQACYSLLRRLLLPLIPQHSTIAMHPSWNALVKNIMPWICSQMNKPKNWHSIYTFGITVICLTPREYFFQYWPSFVSAAQSKLKEKSLRPAGLRALCWLVWKYLNAFDERDSTKKIAELVKWLFQSGKKSIISTEIQIAEPLVHLVRIVAHKLPEFAFDNILFPLMNRNAFVGANPPNRPDQLEPDRMVIGIRSFLAIIGDLELGEHPPFPLTFENEDEPVGKQEPHPIYASMGFRRQKDTRLKRSVTLSRDRLSRAVDTSKFPDFLRENYTAFCKILSQVTMICDEALGGQATITEMLSPTVPRTPMADALGFRRGGNDDYFQIDSSKQDLLDLLHISIQALPRCLSSPLPLTPLIGLLCTSTAHTQSSIASSAAQSLKAIAGQNLAQDIISGFSEFIFDFDDQYSTMSDGGMLGVDHISNALTLYSQLLEIWIQELDNRYENHDIMDESDEIQSIFQRVDEIEGNGLFFLCSPSRSVRAVAVKILTSILRFDSALKRQGTNRVIKILESHPKEIVNVNDGKFTLAQRTRLLHSDGGKQGTIVELCVSTNNYECALWMKIFPDLVKSVFEHSEGVCVITRQVVGRRLTTMQGAVNALAEGQTDVAYPGHENIARLGSRAAFLDPEIFVEQWKLYLIFACTTMTNSGWMGLPANHIEIHTLLKTPGVAQSMPPPPAVSDLNQQSHSRKPSSRGAEKTGSATDLFSKLMLLLTAPSVPVREAVVAGLAAINVSLYRPLLSALKPAVVICDEEVKTRSLQHQRTPSANRQQRVIDTLRTQVTCLYQSTSHFISLPEVHSDVSTVENVVSFMRSTMKHLGDQHLGQGQTHLKLRLHFCGLVESLYEGLRCTGDPMVYMPFELRRTVFSLLEEWCGFLPTTQLYPPTNQDDVLCQSSVGTAAIEIEKRNVRTAALSAMASLCAGPIEHNGSRFDIQRIIEWMERAFATVSDRTHTIGQSALFNLLIWNLGNEAIFQLVVEQCYTATSSKALVSYMIVFQKVLRDAVSIDTESQRHSFLHRDQSFWTITCLGLYLLGNESETVRIHALNVLRALELKEDLDSSLELLSASIAGRTRSVYRHAQKVTSSYMAATHARHATAIISEFTRSFQFLKSHSEKAAMCNAMAPWANSIQLNYFDDSLVVHNYESVADYDKPNGQVDVNSWVVLVNLFDITFHNSAHIQMPLQIVWEGLASSPHNVFVILDFLIWLSVVKREQNFVEHCRIIVLFIAHTESGKEFNVLHFLLSQLGPRRMVPPEVSFSMPPEDQLASFPHVANIEKILIGDDSTHAYSVGYVCMALLVDLVGWAPLNISDPDEDYLFQEFPNIAQVGLVMWDHRVALFREQARELIVNLMRRIQLSQSKTDQFRQINNLLTTIDQGGSLHWSYDDPGPRALTDIARHMVGALSSIIPSFLEKWISVALDWAILCSVRHLACRSFQLFRTLFSTSTAPIFTSNLMRGMLARLSNTIACEEGVLVFSREILLTLTTIIKTLPEDEIGNTPLLFWAISACLGTVHESEYIEGLRMLDAYIDKEGFLGVSLGSLMDSQPPSWEGEFGGIQELVYTGLRADTSYNDSVSLLMKLVLLPSHPAIGDDTRVMYTIVAITPLLVQSIENQSDASSWPGDSTLCEWATRLASIGSCPPNAAAALNALCSSSRPSKDSLLKGITSSMAITFLPNSPLPIMMFLFSFLSNRRAFIKSTILDLLSMFVPLVDVRSPELSSLGPDLISPLLRLLQTEYCPRALCVLDHLMVMSTNAQLDSHYIRMSVVGHNSSAETRKEYENTSSLYGIPTETGWSIPSPAEGRRIVQANVHAVFSCCQEQRRSVRRQRLQALASLNENMFAGSYEKETTPAPSYVSHEVVDSAHLDDVQLQYAPADTLEEETFSLASSEPTELKSLHRPTILSEEDEEQQSEIDLDAAELSLNGNPIGNDSNSINGHLAATRQLAPSVGEGPSATNTTGNTTPAVHTANHSSQDLNAQTSIVQQANDLKAKILSLDRFFDDDDDTSEVTAIAREPSGTAASRQPPGTYFAGLPTPQSHRRSQYGSQYSQYQSNVQSIAEEGESDDQIDLDDADPINFPTNVTLRKNLTNANGKQRQLNKITTVLPDHNPPTLTADQVFDQQTAPTIKNLLEREANLTSPQSSLIDLRSPPNPFAPMTFGPTHTPSISTPRMPTSQPSPPRPSLVRSMTMGVTGMASDTNHAKEPNLIVTDSNFSFPVEDSTIINSPTVVSPRSPIGTNGFAALHSPEQPAGLGVSSPPISAVGIRSNTFTGRINNLDAVLKPDGTPGHLEPGSLEKPQPYSIERMQPSPADKPQPPLPTVHARSITSPNNSLTSAMIPHHISHQKAMPSGLSVISAVSAPPGAIALATTPTTALPPLPVGAYSSSTSFCTLGSSNSVGQSSFDGFIPRASQKLRVGMRRLTGGSTDRDADVMERERKQKKDGFRAVLGRGSSRVRHAVEHIQGHSTHLSSLSNPSLTATAHAMNAPGVPASSVSMQPPVLPPLPQIQSSLSLAGLGLSSSPHESNHSATESQSSSSRLHLTLDRSMSVSRVSPKSRSAVRAQVPMNILDDSQGPKSAEP